MWCCGMVVQCGSCSCMANCSMLILSVSVWCPELPHGRGGPAVMFADILAFLWYCGDVSCSSMVLQYGVVAGGVSVMS